MEAGTAGVVFGAGTRLRDVPRAGTDVGSGSFFLQAFCSRTWYSPCHTVRPHSTFTEHYCSLLILTQRFRWPSVAYIQSLFSVAHGSITLTVCLRHGGFLGRGNSSMSKSRCCVWRELLAESRKTRRGSAFFRSGCDGCHSSPPPFHFLTVICIQKNPFLIQGCHEHSEILYGNDL